MISFIKGIVSELWDNGAVIEQGGIGYLVSMPASVIQKLPPGSEAKVLIHMQVKEDGITLFGFITQEERSLFQKLITINGVGPKAALALLSAMTPSQLILAVITEDITALSRAQGIGKKTASRIALELKDKMKAQAVKDELDISPQVGLSTVSGAKQDAIDALSALGYARNQAVRAVMEVYVPELDAEQTIKLALKKLVN